MKSLARILSAAAVSLVLLPTNARAALFFGYNTDFANVNIFGNTYQPGFPAQGLKIELGAIGANAKIGFTRAGTVGARKPDIFDRNYDITFIDDRATRLTETPIFSNPFPNIASVQHFGKPGEVVSKTGFVHAFANGCAEADQIVYTQSFFTDPFGNRVGLNNYALPAVGQVRQRASSCDVRLSESVARLSESLVAENQESTDLTSVIYRIFPEASAFTAPFVSYFQAEGETELVFSNPESFDMTFNIQAQLVDRPLDVTTLLDENLELAAGFGDLMRITLAPGEEIVIAGEDLTPVPEPATILGTFAILGLGGAIKRKHSSH